jgi:glycosyltransferase involved in cell wall biosynthesis
MPVIYRLGDIYMLPSLGPGETWGLGVNEAMASGCAIMMSDRAGGSADLVETGINGIRFDPANDLETCCDLVNRLLGDPALLEQYKNESRRLIGSFSYRQLVDSLSPDLF